MVTFTILFLIFLLYLHRERKDRINIRIKPLIGLEITYRMMLKKGVSNKEWGKFESQTQEAMTDPCLDTFQYNYLIYLMNRIKNRKVN